jgi:hypothetical protein
MATTRAANRSLTAPRSSVRCTSGSFAMAATCRQKKARLIAHDLLEAAAKAEVPG